MTDRQPYKVIVTTSDKYHHLLPVFFKCFSRHWNVPFDLVGYKEPPDLPDNCTFVSLGEQRGPKYFSDDLAPYFAKQPKFFIWLFEDSFIKSVDHQRLALLFHTVQGLSIGVQLGSMIGRICLSREGMNRPHIVNGDMWAADPVSLYRLSTQPSIWNRDFLLHYLTPGLTPWQFEKQTTKDNWTIIGPVESVVMHNEGVTKHDIYKLNLEGIEP